MKDDTIRGNPLDIAERFIRQGRPADAKRTLAEFVKKIPADWRPVMENERGIVNIFFWDTEEFMSYVSYMKSKPSMPQKSVNWVQPSYTKALYYLAFIAVEEQDWRGALDYLERALSLEPDHPTLLSEKAMVCTRTGRHRDACALHLEAAAARPWSSPSQKARALRGAGVALIDLGELARAEETLKESLGIEPGNQLALKELAYIEQLKKGRKPVTAYDLHRK